jgi:hypothetical protein
VLPRDAGSSRETRIQGSRNGACKLTAGKEASCLDTLGAAYAETGEFDKRIKYVKAALQVETDEENAQESRERLRLYEQRNRYRDE